ncbi:uncharacterized protein LOC143693362 isoform X1 [Agelaius phoeniceus]|uniref:uncharacterized protein LOC143693362 isoform X1 n=1 Tax=Agelaius phoeniceus TaxID=39638 RepID=UPI004055301B
MAAGSNPHQQKSEKLQQGSQKRAWTSTAPGQMDISYHRQVIKSGTYLCSSANSQHQTSVSKAMGSQVRGLEDQVGLWPDRAGRRRPSPFALPGHPSYRRRAGTSSPGLCARPRATRALPADNGNLRGLHACGRRHREMRDGQRDETPLPRAGPPRPRLPPCHGRPLAPRPPPPRGRD